MSNQPLARVYNFNSGPAMLPLSVLEEIRDGFMNFGGMSVLEIGHRGRVFGEIIDEAQCLVRELMSVPKGYHILFLSGGASQQFAMIPMNLMEKVAAYSITGSWSKKAFAEAKVLGSPHEAWSSASEGFTRVPRPDEVNVSRDVNYLHITSNETIEGLQYHIYPGASDVPLIADMSSDVLSRLVDVSRFGLIYASAQKNIGPAGVTLVIIRDDLARPPCREIPKIFRYVEHVQNNSLYNTPPVFAIYVTVLVLRWLKNQGGVAAIEKQNREKAKLLYDVLDQSFFYKTLVDRASRSMMNVVFSLPTLELTRLFLKEAEERGMVGLAGHRSVGGIRASIYNAFPIEGVRALAAFMGEFEMRLHQPSGYISQP